MRQDASMPHEKAPRGGGRGEGWGALTSGSEAARSETTDPLSSGGSSQDDRVGIDAEGGSDALREGGRGKAVTAAPFGGSEAVASVEGVGVGVVGDGHR